jgi:hypothetical protein
MVYGREVALQFFMPPRVCQSIIGVRLSYQTFIGLFICYLKHYSLSLLRRILAK